MGPVKWIGVGLAVAVVGAACGPGTETDVSALVGDPIRQVALSTVSDLPDPPPGEITVQYRVRYQGPPLPGEGIVFHKTIPETDGLFSMKSLPSGQAVPKGQRIDNGIMFVKAGDRAKVELVFENPTDKDAIFVGVPWYAEPASAQLGLTNQCFCAGVPWLAPAGGAWYRTIYTDFDAKTIKAGTKMAIVWTVVTDPGQFALQPDETLEQAVQKFNQFAKP